ncbi:serine hydrolase domain-containing protein [Streptomyces sp. HSW2009]|uniref:serine hydrolase domain-containing protein n=1 Tax=Streptomyces sp. HSW2009 TaxID=3142890 RepID=UPI0032F009B1
MTRLSDRPPAPSSRPAGARFAPRRPRRALAVAAVVSTARAVGATLPATAAPHRPQDTVGQGLVHLVRDDQYPAALAATTEPDGRTRNQVAGVADLRTGAKAPLNGRVRAGSNTKTFTAAVVLQLVGEGKVGLDQPVDRYLPGLVRGEGIDGRNITVRQLLQHTSGLPDYVPYLGDITGSERHTYVQPRTTLDLGLAHKALFAPGAGWEYSNTNYTLAGLIIEKVTGRPLAEEITRRIIDRIGLRHTTFPGVGDERIPGPHPRGYYADKAGAPLQDMTELDPSWGWAAGQLISTPADLNRFFTALLGGELLAPAQLAEMRTTVPTDGKLWAGARYGLGLISTPLTCGGLAWGHGGDIPGYQTRGGAPDRGRAGSVAVTADRHTVKQGPGDVRALVDSALCR